MGNTLDQKEETLLLYQKSRSSSNTVGSFSRDVTEEVSLHRGNTLIGNTLI